MTNLEQQFRESPFVSYAYSYPHKTAYRALASPVSLKVVWAAERKDALFLYLHVPFCEMRCGFCNLFTTANPREDLVDGYLNALSRQAAEVKASIGPARFARMAIGGGTPTFLNATQLSRLFDIAAMVLGGEVPASCETSPLTADEARLNVLRERGIERISIGVQSFVEAEVGAIGRSQKTSSVERALELIRKTGFRVLNLDLMYGLPDQTVDSWLASLRSALRYKPEELYLYPLYVRPLTGMGRNPKLFDDTRLACYREGRSLLASAGYEQLSMRMFRSSTAVSREGPVYCCQDDGMIGLGCGARSYARELHYSNEYAVGACGINEIVASYVESTAFKHADYGFRLTREEQCRRFIIKSILRTEGLDLNAYRERFKRDAEDDLPHLLELLSAGLAVLDGGKLSLTDAGIELSDAIGPWLYSPNVQTLMSSYELH